MQPAEVTPAPSPAPRRAVAREVVGFIVIGALLITAVAAGLASLYRSFWGPSAFAERYVHLLADGRAADALAIDGVAVGRDALDDADLAVGASDALLRSTALGDGLSGIRAVGERDEGDGVTEVTVEYRIDGERHETRLQVAMAGWNGLVPTWRFAASPLTEIVVDTHGSWRFTVNGFEVDKRQVSPEGLEADPADPIPLLVFAPMEYDISVDTATTVADPVTTVASDPLSMVDVEVDAEPSDAFQKVLDEKSASWLSEECGSRNVLLPEDCPYGYELDALIAPGTEPEWTITEYPDIRLTEDGAWWSIEPADGIAHIELDMQSYVDGSISHVSEDVPFRIDGTVELLQDGSAKIEIGAPLLR